MNRTISIAAVFVATAGLVLAALPAQAVSPPDESEAELRAPAALTVPSVGGAELQMRPRDASALMTEDHASWSLGDEGTPVATSPEEQLKSLYGVIPASDGGESRFEFDITVADAPAVLAMNERGGVTVAGASGDVVNRLAPPTGSSSSGTGVEARYEVRGDVLAVVIDAPSDAGDVTVQASYECNIGFCTSVMTRAETRAVANGDYAVAMAVIALVCGPAAGLCGLGFVYLVQQAKGAASKGVCVGVRKVNVSAVAWIVHESCRR